MRENEYLLRRPWQRYVAEDSTVLIEAKFVKVDIRPGNYCGHEKWLRMSNRLNRTHEINETRSLEITVSLEVGCRGGENLFDALRLADELAPNGKGAMAPLNMRRGRTRPLVST